MEALYCISRLDMNKQEAYSLAIKELEQYEILSYSELKEHVGENYNKEKQADSGVLYQIDTQVFWDCKNKKNIRVMVSVDNMGWFAFAPITESILVRP